jgi:hypothetical protein
MPKRFASVQQSKRRRRWRYNTRVPKECAFCPSTAKLSAEHIFSDWMNDLFPGTKRFSSADTETKSMRNWTGPDLDLKLKVVCESCNNTWMSGIEHAHAKPCLTDLITGKVDVPISEEYARSIALFAFKTIAICDHSRRNYPARFFPREIRYMFKSALEITPTVQMCFAGFLPRTHGLCTTIYHDVPGPEGLKLYVCTYAVGHFVFQGVAFRKPVSWLIRPHNGAFENLAVPFWPRIPLGFSWPPQNALSDARELRAFASRWARIDINRPIGG